MRIAVANIITFFEQGAIFSSISRERERQECLKKEGKFRWTCSDRDVTDAAKLAVLAEEFGEVSRHVVEGLIDSNRRKPDELRKELIEVAAVCVAWCEGLP